MDSLVGRAGLDRQNLARISDAQEYHIFVEKVFHQAVEDCTIVVEELVPDDEVSDLEELQAVGVLQPERKVVIGVVAGSK